MVQSATFPHHGEAEHWLPVVGYEGWYEVSSLGRVRSVTRRIAVQTPQGLKLKTYRSRVLSQTPDSRRKYLMVHLCRSGENTTRLVHQLVAEAFIGPRPDEHEVRHGPNGNRDNRASQLSYGTKKENAADCVRDHATIRGEKAGMAKLTWDAVTEIRRRVASGETQRMLAAEFGVTFQNISMIVLGKTWLYPPEEW